MCGFVLSTCNALEPFEKPPHLQQRKHLPVLAVAETFHLKIATNSRGFFVRSSSSSSCLYVFNVAKLSMDTSSWQNFTHVLCVRFSEISKINLITDNSLAKLHFEHGK
jgi:hypothetical protein